MAKSLEKSVHIPVLLHEVIGGLTSPSPLGLSSVSLDPATAGHRETPTTPVGAANALLCIREDILDFIVGFERFD